MRDYPDAAIDRAKQGALWWLAENKDGYPRSRQQEDANTKYLGEELYDDFEAPPILGYEVLEREGRVQRLGAFIADGEEERVHFKLISE